MMSDAGSSWNAMLQYGFLRVFANDGTLDVRELAMLERLAMADGLLDAHEREVLEKVFTRAEEGGLSDDVREGIARLRARYPAG
jgi:hypothetical protein